MTRKRLIKTLTRLLIGLILTAVGVYLQQSSGGNKADLSLAEVGYYNVISIADGDTITVDMEGKKEKIRLIGVDTPEVHHGGNTAPSECYGDKAKAFAETLIDSRRVKLVKDVKGSNRDKYGRLLRYIYSHDNRSLDELLVSEGYGFAVDGFSYSKKEEMLSLMSEAEMGRKGLWGVCQIDRSKGYPEVAS